MAGIKTQPVFLPPFYGRKPVYKIDSEILHAEKENQPAVTGWLFVLGMAWNLPAELSNDLVEKDSVIFSS